MSEKKISWNENDCLKYFDECWKIKKGKKAKYVFGVLISFLKNKNVRERDAKFQRINSKLL